MKIVFITLFLSICFIAVIITAVLLLSGFKFDFAGSDRSPYLRAGIDANSFKTEAYPALSTIETTAGYTVSHLNQRYGQIAELQHLPEQKLIYFFATSERSESLVLLNYAGKEVTNINADTLVTITDEAILLLDGYHRMSISDVSARTPYQDISDQVKTKNDLAALYGMSDGYIQSFSYTGEPVHLFFYDNTWHMVTTKTNLSSTQSLAEKISTPHIAELSTITHFTDSDGQTVGEEPNTAYRIQLDYFQKQDYLKRRGPSIGSVTGSDSGGYWTGTAYYNLNTPDAQTIQFNVSPAVLTGPKSSRTGWQKLYTVPEANLVFFSHDGGANQKGRQFYLFTAESQ